MQSFIHLCLLAFAVTCTLSCAQTIEDAQNLLDDKLNPLRYNKRVRGISDQSKAVLVNVSMLLKAIVHLSEVDEVMETQAVLFIHWNDERLMWDPSSYNGTMQIKVFQEDIWRPEVTLGNPAREAKLLGDDRLPLTVDYTGRVLWFVGDNFESACYVNVKAYPWDTQVCNMEFFSYGQAPTAVILHGADKPMDMAFYRENGEWIIVGTSAKEEDRVAVSGLIFTFKLKRRAMLDVVIVIIPTATLSILNLFVFVLPIESGERVSYSLTVLLSTAVLLTFTSDHLPKKADTIAAICYCIAALLVMSTAICAYTVFSLFLYHQARTGDRLPTWLACLVRLRLNDSKQQRQCANGQLTPDVTVSEMTESNMSPIIEEVGAMHREEAGADNMDMGWRVVSKWFDRVCFTVTLFWLVAMLLTYIVMVMS